MNSFKYMNSYKIIDCDNIYNVCLSSFYAAAFICSTAISRFHLLYGFVKSHQ